MAGSSQHGSGPITGINVTPLVDIVLVLLIIFMVTAKIIVAPAVPMDLPQASQGQEVQVVFSVIIPVVGAALINGKPVADETQFVALAQTAARENPDLRAVINADGAVPHRTVIHALDLLKSAGIRHIAFGAQPKGDGAR